MTSFYTSLNGLKNSQTDLSTIAHNIANAETTGFKKSNVEFADIVSSGSAANPRMTQGIGATVAGINQNFGLGAIEQGAAWTSPLTAMAFLPRATWKAGRYYSRAMAAFRWMTLEWLQILQVRHCKCLKWTPPAR
jgi:hypothetical protein